MGRRPAAASQQSSIPVNLTDLPEDGTPVAFQATFAKRTQASVDTPSMNIEDYENKQWLVEKYTGSGWATIDQVTGRPYKPTLRNMYGEGRWRVVPLDDQGRPLEQLARTEIIGVPETAAPPAAPAAAPTAQVIPLPGAQVAPAASGGADMPPWMQMWMQQQAEDRRMMARAEAARAEREDEHRRRMEERDMERADREERRLSLQEEREREERKAAQERQMQLLQMGMKFAETVMTQISAAIATKSDKPDINDVLLTAVVRPQLQAPPPPKSDIREFLEMYQLMQELTGGRDNGSDEAPDSFGQMLAGMAPLLLQSRQGVAPDPVQIQQFAQQSARRILSDPDMVAGLLKENPQGAARTIREALRRNPTLEQAVFQVLAEDDDDEAAKGA